MLFVIFLCAAAVKVFFPEHYEELDHNTDWLMAVVIAMVRDCYCVLNIALKSKSK